MALNPNPVQTAALLVAETLHESIDDIFVHETDAPVWKDGVTH